VLGNPLPFAEAEPFISQHRKLQGIILARESSLLPTLYRRVVQPDFVLLHSQKLRKQSTERVIRIAIALWQSWANFDIRAREKIKDPNLVRR
jgi:hypothetical protein